MNRAIKEQLERMPCVFCDREGLELCGEMGRDHSFICTRDVGHEGPHVACGDTEHSLRAWYSEPWEPVVVVVQGADNSWASAEAVEVIS
jgi:hypothetical protein